MNSTTLLLFLSGKYSKRTSFIYLIFVLAVFVLFMLAALVAFPSPFSIFFNAVSNLGNHTYNPFPGWLYFSLGLWIFGPVALPLFLYQFRALKQALKGTAVMFLAFSFVGIVGMVGVGIIPEDGIFELHILFAAMAFGGLFLSSFFSWFSIIAIIIKEKVIRIKVILGIILGIMVVTGIGITVTASIMYINVNINNMPEYGFFYLNFWEWMFFLMLAFQIIMLTVLINIPGTKSSSNT